MTANPDDRFTIDAPHGSFVVEDNHNNVEVVMRGEFDISSEEPSQGVVEIVGELVGLRSRPVFINAADLEFLDASGIRFLLRIDRIAQLTGSWACVTHPNRNIRRLLALVDLERLLDEPSP